MIVRLLTPQGLAGLAVAICLGILLLLQKGETRHWRKQSVQFEQLYRAEQAAFSATVANYRAAAATARAAEAANAARVAAEQRTINERTAHDFETRLAAARAAAERLRRQAAAAATNPSGGGSASVPRLPPAAGGTAEGAGEDRFSEFDRLTATEQAIQLDELIKWVREQHAVRVGGVDQERP
jgi:signal transduction histidine kinase